MTNELRTYIKNLSPKKKQKVYNLRREMRDSRLCYMRLKKHKNYYEIIDLNNNLICIIPMLNNSMIKTFFIAYKLVVGFDEYLMDTFDSDYFFQDKRFNNKKTLFNKGFNLDDIDFLAGCFPC